VRRRAGAKDGWSEATAKSIILPSYNITNNLLLVASLLPPLFAPCPALRFAHRSLRKPGEDWGKFQRKIGREGRVEVREVEADVDMGALRMLKEVMGREEEGELGYEEEHVAEGGESSSSVPSSDEEEGDEEDEE